MIESGESEVSAQGVQAWAAGAAGKGIYGFTVRTGIGGHAPRSNGSATFARATTPVMAGGEPLVDI